MARYADLVLPGCPLCRATARAEQQFLNWFVLENYTSLPTLVRLRRSRFCRWHTEWLLANTGVTDLTVTFHALSRSEREVLGAFRHELLRETRTHPDSHSHTRILPPAAQPVDSPTGCPACEAGLVAATADGRLLLTTLATSEGRAVYRSHESGLCRPHLWLVLRMASTDTADWLATESETRLDRLTESFSRYFHRRDEPRGDDQFAWHRGLRFFWGEPAVGDDGNLRSAWSGMEPTPG